MLHQINGSFDIAIPAEFLHWTHRFTESDFKFKVNVQYLFDKDKFTIKKIESDFEGTKAIDWNRPELEEYFINGAKNHCEAYIPEPELHHE